MAKRRKPQARRGGSGRRVPIWIWLLGGMLMGLGLSAALIVYERNGSLPFPQPNPAAKAPREAEQPIAQRPATPAEKPKPRYDFYTLLRERETQVSDRELAERVKAETTPAPAPAPVETPAPAPSSRERFLIQAGAFRDLRDADAVKARIALAGLQARVESANVNGQTIHRVRLGPYATASELEAAKRQLAENGVPDTLAVRETLD